MIAAVIQMNSTEERTRNLVQAEGLLRQAKARGAKLAVLPEYFACLKHQGLPWNRPEPLQGPTVSFLSNLAQELGIWILGGSFAQKSGKGKLIYDTSPLLDDRGRLVALYQKIHLFDLAVPGQRELRETVTALPGRRVVVAETPLGALGMSICYDLRFPELYRRLRLKGAQIFAAPSAFTKTTGQSHWELLVRTRAVENQCYMLAAAQWGAHGCGRESFGRAMIVDPWGQILAECRPGTGLALAKLDLRRVQQVRRLLNSTANARLLPRSWGKD